MPEQEPTHTPTSGTSKDAEPTNGNRADLDPLFREWAAIETAPRRHTPDARIDQMQKLRRGLNIRIAAMVVLAFMAAIVMWKTRHGVAYWLESSTPVELGDLRKAWVSGNRVFEGEHDTYVHVSGLVPTRLIGVAADPDAASPTELEYVFFCPLFNLTVLSKQKVDIPTGGLQEMDPALQRVVIAGLADPGETMVSWQGNGRLLRGDAAPPELRAFVTSYGRRMGKHPEQTWVLIEDKAPSDYTPSVILWFVALVPFAASILFYVRARRAWLATTAAGQLGAPIT